MENHHRSPFKEEKNEMAELLKKPVRPVECLQQTDEHGGEKLVGRVCGTSSA